MEDTLPPCNPDFVVLIAPCTGMPSRHHDSFAGGLLELESQVNTACVLGLNSSGSFLILTVSGATVNKTLFYFL